MFASKPPNHPVALRAQPPSSGASAKPRQNKKSPKPHSLRETELRIGIWRERFADGDAKCGLRSSQPQTIPGRFLQSRVFDYRAQETTAISSRCWIASEINMSSAI